MTEAERQTLLVLNVAVNDLTEEIRGLRSDLQQWSQPTVVATTACNHLWEDLSKNTADPKPFLRCHNCGLTVPVSSRSVPR